MTPLPARVKIVEVGPRDGLQNEPETIDTAAKVRFIQLLAESGLQNIEVSSFVHPKAIPQLADALDVIRQLPTKPTVQYSALVPNQKGLERAIQSGVKRIAVFTAASETFTQRNIQMSIADSLKTFAIVVRDALAQGVTVRGYVSTAFVCPFEGDIDRTKVLDVCQALLQLGVDEVSVSDTIGAASPKDVHETVGYLLQSIPKERIALHFHDTYGTALANVYAGLELGIQTFDASAGGLGGCPYAPGASGNLATEDLVYFLDRMGIAHGVSITKLAEASNFMASVLKRDLPSKQWKLLRSLRACDERQ